MMKNYFKNFGDFSSGKQVFWLGFLFSVLCYITFLAFRGFGWDGDTFGSASQFVRLINHNIYPVDRPSMGTAAKLLMIIVSGALYRLFGNLYALTFISILLNSLMIAIICKWIYRLNGHWVVSLVAIMMNILWNFQVLSCDNPALSLPFVVFGLYCYFQLSRKSLGAFYILIGSLFRPGPEIILLFLILYELRRKNLKINLLLCFSLSMIHLLFAYKLAFASAHDSAIFLNHELVTSTERPMRSIKAITVYLKGIYANIKVNQLSNLLLFPAILGFIECLKSRNSIRFFILCGFVSYLVPLGNFVYGVNVGTFTHYMEYLLVIQVFAGFFMFDKLINIDNWVKKIGGVILTVLCVIMVFNIAGRHRQYYEINPIDGTGFARWPSVYYKNTPLSGTESTKNLGLNDARKSIKPRLKDQFYKVLTDEKDLLWVVLDFGDKAKSITVAENKHFNGYSLDEYDIILLPAKAVPNINIDNNLFERNDVGASRLMLIKRGLIR